MFKAKRYIKKDSIAITYIICLAISTILLLIFSLVAALIASSLDDPTKNLGIFSLVAMILSAICSGVICTRIKGEGGTRFVTLVALAIVLIMLLVNVIICSGKVSGGAFMNYVCYLAISALSAFIGKKGEKSRKHKH